MDSGLSRPTPHSTRVLNSHDTAIYFTNLGITFVHAKIFMHISCRLATQTVNLLRSRPSRTCFVAITAASTSGDDGGWDRAHKVTCDRPPVGDLARACQILSDARLQQSSHLFGLTGTSVPRVLRSCGLSQVPMSNFVRKKTLVSVIYVNIF